MGAAAATAAGAGTRARLLAPEVRAAVNARDVEQRDALKRHAVAQVDALAVGHMLHQQVQVFTRRVQHLTRAHLQIEELLATAHSYNTKKAGSYFAAGCKPQAAPS